MYLLHFFLHLYFFYTYTLFTLVLFLTFVLFLRLYFFLHFLLFSHLYLRSTCADLRDRWNRSGCRHWSSESMIKEVDCFASQNRWVNASLKQNMLIGQSQWINESRPALNKRSWSLCKSKSIWIKAIIKTEEIDHLTHSNQNQCVKGNFKTKEVDLLANQKNPGSASWRWSCFRRWKRIGPYQWRAGEHLNNCLWKKVNICFW